MRSFFRCREGDGRSWCREERENLKFRFAFYIIFMPIRRDKFSNDVNEIDYSNK